jgi:hypothetical protein
MSSRVNRILSYHEYETVEERRDPIKLLMATLREHMQVSGRIGIEEDFMPEPVQPTEFSSSKEEEPEVKVEDPLEEFCEEDPSADECRVYED